MSEGNNQLIKESNVGELYTKFLTQALNNVGKDYFRIKTTYGLIVRERVFCYEFYHQMRLLEINAAIKANLSLSGEIDKRGNESIDSQDWRNPDFVLHKYGTFKMNEVIIEVKGQTSNDIFKDFKTLNRYCEKYNYRNAYFIIYNYNLNNLKDFLTNKEEYFNKISMESKIVIICKKDVNTSCEIITLNRLREEIYC